MMFAKGDFKAQLLGGDGGRTGGRSRSPKKQAAARKNGKLGGRPPTRTLAEILLNRPLNTAQRRQLTESGREYMLIGNVQALENFFHASDLHSSGWRKPRGKVPVRVKHAIAQLKLVARYCLANR